MKKAVLLLALSVSCLLTYSQTTSIGINGGFGHSWNTNNPSVRNKFFPYGNLGISFFHSNKSHFAFGADLNYSLEGSKTTWPGGDLVYNLESRQQYVRLPLKAYYFFAKESSLLRPKIYAGPALGYLIKTYNTEEIVAPSSNYSTEGKATSLYNRLDFGLQAGAGLNLKLSERTLLSTDINYYNGVINMYKNDNSRKNNNASISVGVLWKLGKK
jgi:hypothetical protein